MIEILREMENLKDLVLTLHQIRTLKENVEKTDERTGDINNINNKFISILSGKWNTCIHVANKLDKLLSK